MRVLAKHDASNEAWYVREQSTVHTQQAHRWCGPLSCLTALNGRNVVYCQDGMSATGMNTRINGTCTRSSSSALACRAFVFINKDGICVRTRRISCRPSGCTTRPLDTIWRASATGGAFLVESCAPCGSSSFVWPKAAVQRPLPARLRLQPRPADT